MPETPCPAAAPTSSPLSPAVLPADVAAVVTAHPGGPDPPLRQRSEGPSPATAAQSSPATGMASATGNAMAAYKRAASASPGARHSGLGIATQKLHTSVSRLLRAAAGSIRHQSARRMQVVCLLRAFVSDIGAADRRRP